MSFPTIPDITPDIDIDFCDAVNLLLSSIALEEISLSRLMDAGGQHPVDTVPLQMRRLRTGGCYRRE